MISRRILRIKALMEFYAFNRREDNDLDKAEKELLFSIEKAFDLYHYLFLLITDIADIAQEKIEAGLQKNIPSEEDLNPNRRFVDNRVIAILRKNESLKSYLNTRKLSWNSMPEVPRIIYNKLVTWEPFMTYIRCSVLHRISCPFRRP
jgi:N utilization substance protein B